MIAIRKPFMIGVSAVIAAAAATALISASPRAAEKLDKEEVRQIMREYLQEHPEMVIEAIESYQANQQQIEARKFKETLADKASALKEGDLPFAGNPNGDVVVVEFFDYNCGYCKRAIADVSKVLEQDKNVKFVFRDMPILSETSHDAARYALASHKQGKYFEYHQALMMSNGGKSQDELESIAKGVGLDVDKLRADADSKEIRAEIEESLALSRDLGIRGTPAFIIGDTLAPGYMTYQNMLDVIKDVRDGEG